MPSKNVIKRRVGEAYYHIYARGASKQLIFVDESDFVKFLRLLKRYLSVEPTRSSTGGIYPNFHKRIDLLAYCLMGNHIHLLIWQRDELAMTELMRALMTSYSRYFNLKYKRTGSLFESRYKASLIDQQNYLQHISRYIHLNPRYWKRYPYSSLTYYFDRRPEWLNPEKIESLFTNRADYLLFLEDYEDQRDILQMIKYTLANY
ncbi:MAG TPA: transposase [Candidatus Saccharimonadales bacterium]|nr:transposase [Candidatus Saccharimonadales bacterium]